MPLYSRSPYSVFVADNGEIKVKQGDWLSKYSYAMFGNYTTINDFVRPPAPTRSGLRSSLEDGRRLRTRI